ncbi:MAG: hypothetical protein COB09_02570 [Thalassobium sp.]|nr:MAG: hypothetical protein COB09_02570 [Thalassobium sp.]
MKLYRFEKPDIRRIDTLEEGRIWMSKPEYFNDIYDCRLPINNYDSSRFTLEAIKQAAEVMYASMHIMAKKDYFNDADFVEEVMRWCKSKRKGSSMPGFVKMFTSKVRQLGIQSFTELDYQSPLMWSHYADNHRGFCIQYELDDYALNRFYNGYKTGFSDMNYTTMKVEFDFKEILFMPIETALSYITHKTAHWAYEKEKRLIYTPEPGQQGKHGYSITLPSYLQVTAIYGGLNSKPRFKNRLKQCANNLGISYYAIDIDKLSFDLDIARDDSIEALIPQTPNTR